MLALSATPFPLFNHQPATRHESTTRPLSHSQVPLPGPIPRSHPPRSHPQGPGSRVPLVFMSLCPMRVASRAAISCSRRIHSFIETAPSIHSLYSSIPLFAATLLAASPAYFIRSIVSCSEFLQIMSIVHHRPSLALLAHFPVLARSFNDCW